MEEKVRELHFELLRRIEPRLSARQVEILKKTKISFNKRLRTALGRANLRQNWIQLNSGLLEKYPGELEPTLAHEFAHLVAPMLFGRRGFAHQEGWRQVMRMLGFHPERTHRLPVGELLRQHRIVARAICGCRERSHEIKPRRHRKMLYGRRRYRCLTCLQEIKLVSNAC